MTKQEEKQPEQGRRGFLKIAGAAAAGLVVGAAAGYGLAPKAALGPGPGPSMTTTQTLTETMSAVNALQEAGIGGPGQKYYMVGYATEVVFWKPLIHALDLASKWIGANFVWTGPSGVDTAECTNDINTAIAAKADGIATVAYEAGFEGAVGAVLDAGIPFLCFNDNAFQRMPQFKGTRYEQTALVGADELQHGLNVGRKAGASVPVGSKFLLTNPYPGTAWAETRTKGILQGLAENGQTSYDNIATDIDDTKCASIVESYLRGHSDVKAIVDVGGGFGDPIALKDLGLAPHQIKLFMFNLDPEILPQIKAGYVEATTDQIVFYQGLYTAFLLWAKRNLGIDPININTAHGFCDASNVDSVMNLVQGGWR